MTDVRLDRADDGRCTLFIGRTLVFTDLTEARARELAEVFSDVPLALSTPRPIPASVQRGIGGRAGRTLLRSPSHASEQALARLR